MNDPERRYLFELDTDEGSFSVKDSSASVSTCSLASLIPSNPVEVANHHATWESLRDRRCHVAATGRDQRRSSRLRKTYGETSEPFRSPDELGRSEVSIDRARRLDSTGV